MHSLNNHRVIALDVRPSRLGYAVFEGPERLLDWGVKSFRGGVNAVQVPFGIKITRLISEWQPSAVVLKKPNTGRVAQKTRIIQDRAKSCRVRVCFISGRATVEAFPPLGNKYERARLLAASLPELTAQLPPKRKAWQSEHYQMCIFDAATVGAAYFWRLKKT